jgi:Na+/phosphate symporter
VSFALECRDATSSTNLLVKTLVGVNCGVGVQARIVAACLLEESLLGLLYLGISLFFFTRTENPAG